MMRLQDNTSYQMTDDFEKLFRLANVPISSLLNEKGDNLLVFPFSHQRCEDKINEQYLFDISSSSHGFTLKTGNMVGFIGMDGLTIDIQSRFSDVNSSEDYFLHYMLQKVLSVNLFDLKHTTTDEQVFDFLLYLFPYYLNDALSQGLYKDYQRNEYNDANVRGVIDFNRHIKSNIPFGGKVAYRTREFSHDNSITQLIRHTIEYIRTKAMGEIILHSNPDTQAYVSLIVASTARYQKKDRQKIIQNNLKPVRHPYFTRYTALQTLCLKILRYEQLKYGGDKNDIYGILFDVSWLWEQYLAILLAKQGFKHSNSQCRKGGFYLARHSSDRSNKFLRLPDFYDKEEGGCVMDAKYKREVDCVSDVNQLITYMYRLKSRSGVFIQPVMEKADTSQYMLKGYGEDDKACLHIYRFPINGGVASFEEFKKEMKKSEELLDEFVAKCLVKNCID